MDLFALLWPITGEERSLQDTGRKFNTILDDVVVSIDH